MEKVFVDNNKHKCKIIVNGEEKELSEYIYLNENYNGQKELIVTLIDIDKLHDLFCMFLYCTSLFSLPDLEYWDISNILN